MQRWRSFTAGCWPAATFAHEPHHLNLALVIVVAILAEVLGSLAGYLIGYFGGRALVDRAGRYVLLTHRDLDRAEAWFARRGEPVVLFGRFIPLLRSFVSFAAGLGEMAFAKFLLFTVIGCAIWCTALTCLGYSLGGTYHHVLKGFSDCRATSLPPFSSSPWWRSFSTDSGSCARSDVLAETPEPSPPGLIGPDAPRASRGISGRLADDSAVRGKLGSTHRSEVAMNSFRRHQNLVFVIAGLVLPLAMVAIMVPFRSDFADPAAALVLVAVDRRGRCRGQPGSRIRRHAVGDGLVRFLPHPSVREVCHHASTGHRNDGQPLRRRSRRDRVRRPQSPSS